MFFDLKFNKTRQMTVLLPIQVDMRIAYISKFEYNFH